LLFVGYSRHLAILFSSAVLVCLVLSVFLTTFISEDEFLYLNQGLGGLTI